MSTLSQLRELGLFDARVPRYTSYPTAPQFSDRVDGKLANEWIRAIPADSTVSLYAHVPFCKRLCWFCACRTQGTTTLSPVKAYIETLEKELSTIASHLADGISIEHLHWGGGTPTILPAETIARLANTIFSHIPLAQGAQFSVEIDPNEIDDARLDALAAAGMNRASIGVQDFDPLIQKTIGRIQSYEVTHKAVVGLRERGIDSLNMDILYGLPHQTNAGISESVQKVLSLAPDRVALYGYAHVPWMAKRQTLIPTDVLPTPEERLELFDTARELFLADGYEEIGIDHFARPDDGLAIAQKCGQLHRNFQGYTEDVSETLIGIGASAISRYPGGYAQNNPSTSAYQASARAGQLATSRGHEYTRDDLLRARLIEALMCDFNVSIGDIAAQTQTTPDIVRELLHDLPQHFPGMILLDQEMLEILPHARPLTRMIARHLDAYDMSQSGHSPAV
ncbi:MAG: oxygen-independent coproporphyrinogen III oxidase [Marinosulfonomonas sp.]|nr:oxygen-independent coproporphyrinogen III oxidase [Marinosulfonomonas sp.]